MAKTKIATAPMKVAQIPNPGADFQIVEREIPTPDAGQVRIKVQAVVSATVMRSRKTDRGLAFSIPAFPDTKSWA